MVAIVRRHPVAASAFALAAVVLTVVVLIWFEPQKLFLDERVNESLPQVHSADEAAEPDEDGGMSDSPEVLASGEFRPLAHDARGTALLVELADGRTIVRFENFEVENGPDLKVYLSTASADSDEGALVDEFHDLGDLKGNIGNQNYELAPRVDATRFRTVVVWCRRFSVGFAVAPLE
jgi:hypothetical protein